MLSHRGEKMGRDGGSQPVMSVDQTETSASESGRLTTLAETENGYSKRPSTVNLTETKEF